MDATYRSDLRELNELNFARFDAKLEQRLAEVKAEMREGFANLRGDMKASAQELKADLLKWMFGAWATLLGAMIALIKLG